MRVDGRPRVIPFLRNLLLAILSAALLATTRPAAAAAYDSPAAPGPESASNSSDVPGPLASTDPDIAPSTGSGIVPDRPYWRRNLFGRLFSDQKYLFTRWLPSEAHRPGFTIPVLLGTGLALAESRDGDASQPDVAIERDINGDTHGGNLATAHLFSNLGEAPVGMLLIGTAYLTGRWSGHDRFAETASLSAEAVIDTGLWVTVLKGLTARTRPTGGSYGQFFQYHPPAGQQNDSFPSGHASGAFAAATVFAGMYREQHPWVPWIAYGTASLVSASRVALGRHFPTDVFVGAFIGNSFGRMVLSRRQPEERSIASGIMPFYDPATGSEGVAWHREW